VRVGAFGCSDLVDQFVRSGLGEDAEEVAPGGEVKAVHEAGYAVASLARVDQRIQYDRVAFPQPGEEQIQRIVVAGVPILLRGRGRAPAGAFEDKSEIVTFSLNRELRVKGLSTVLGMHTCMMTLSLKGWDYSGSRTNPV
jgi:hypothetical protein